MKPGVVIAGVELEFEDPSPGGQSVWLANRGTGEVDLSCWRLVASRGMGAFIAEGTRLGPGRALRLVTPPGMLGEVDQVRLLDRAGETIDLTPELQDREHDDRLWVLLPGAAWQFARLRLPEPLSDGRLVATC